MANYRINDVNPAIKELAAQLRRNYSMKLADAIVAATALHLNIPLLTTDGGFERLKDVLDLRTL